MHEIFSSFSVYYVKKGFEVRVVMNHVWTISQAFSELCSLSTQHQSPVCLYSASLSTVLITLLSDACLSVVT